MTGTGWSRAWRAALSLVLAFAMATGPIPAPALAEGVDAPQGEGVAPGGGAEPTEVPSPAEGVAPADGVGEPALVDRPVPAEGLVYDGTEQVGVEAGEGYTLAGDARATRAGDYVAVATPAEGFAWADGTTGPVEVAWSIARRPATVV